MRTLQTRDIPKYLLVALATGIVLLAAPVGASAGYTVVKRATPPVAVDHRLDPKVTVRDHRAVPDVRDHRQQATSGGAAKTTAARTTTVTTVSAGGVTYTPREKKVVPAATYNGGGMLGGGR
jgi:hypothetical protein